jgi:hypothetical protein
MTKISWRIQSFLPNAVAFALMGWLAFVQQWSLQEFCWGVWLCGLFYSWACVVTAVAQVMLTARSQKEFYDAKIPCVKRIPPEGFALGIIPVSLLVGFFMLYLYSWIFSFYGLFLSVFAEMKPLNLFGCNGFINSDFFTPVAYLTDNFWPMILATLVANWRDFQLHNALERIIFPFRNRDIFRIHVMILVLPFLAMITWALFRDAYQQWTVVLLIGLFYLLPKKQGGKNNVVRQNIPRP